MRPPTSGRSALTNAVPGVPSPGVSSVPRAKITSMSGHEDAGVTAGPGPGTGPGPGPGPGWAIAVGATTTVVATQAKAEQTTAEQTTADTTAASRADIGTKVTPVIFTY